MKLGTPLLLEDLIREHVSLGSPDRGGFYSLRCACCSDYKVRAGWKFQKPSVIYNCWNCGTTAVYEEYSGKLSKKMRKILNAWGIEDSEISTVINSGFFKTPEEESDTISLSSLTAIDTSTPPSKLPASTFRLGETDKYAEQQSAIIEYLIERRVDPTAFSFYFSTERRFKDRVIIPFWRGGRLIYWTARSIDPAERKRWDNSPEARTAVMFNMDRLQSYSREPLFVTEGIFDALMFDGVALAGSKLNPAKISLLRASTRRLVFVIDKDKNGESLARAALDEGWEITFTPDDSADLNESVCRFGRIWTAASVMRQITSDRDEAELKIRLWCRKHDKIR